MHRLEIIKYEHLDERTVQYVMLAMWACEQLPDGYAGRNVANQLFRSATAVGANYAEASEPESDADFIHKLKVTMKELKESRVWLRFAYGLKKEEFFLQIISESYEIQHMLGASLKRRGYNGWAKDTD